MRSFLRGFKSVTEALVKKMRPSSALVHGRIVDFGIAYENATARQRKLLGLRGNGKLTD